MSMPSSTPPPSGSSRVVLFTVLALAVIVVIVLTQRSSFSSYLKGDTTPPANMPIGTTGGGSIPYCCKGMTGPSDCTAVIPLVTTCVTTSNTNIDTACGNPRCTVAPRLTVTKSVVNNTSGPRPNSYFTLKLDSLTLTSGTQVTTTVGPHSIYVPSDTRYTFVWSGHCIGTNSSTAINLASSDVKACTITITYVPPVCNSPLQSADGQTFTWHTCVHPPTGATTAQLNAYNTCIAPFKATRTAAQTAAQTLAAAQTLVQNSANQKCQQTAGGITMPNCLAAPNETPCHQTSIKYEFLGGSYTCATTASTPGNCATMAVGQSCVCKITGAQCKATATCSL